jgi:hypothetical protein
VKWVTGKERRPSPILFANSNGFIVDISCVLTREKNQFTKIYRTAVALIFDGHKAVVNDSADLLVL